MEVALFSVCATRRIRASGVRAKSWIESTAPSDEVHLNIYTSGFRIVRNFIFDRDQKPEFLQAGTHEFIWDGKDDMGRWMPPGTYLSFIEMNLGKKRYEASGKTELP